MAKRILLISAHPQRALKTQVELLRQGLMVEIAGTIRRGLSVVQHRPPDAVVIDDTFRERDDPSLRDALRAAALAAHIPLIALPEQDTAAQAPRALELGAALSWTIEQPPEHPLIDLLRQEGIL